MYFLLSLTYFGNAIATNQLQQIFFFFHTISVMPLPQIHSHKFFFFFPQFRQRYCQKPTEINFFPSYLAMSLPQFHFTFFFLSYKNATNQIVSVKKNTERIRICVLFFISLLYFGNAIATNNKFFFYYVLFFVFVYNTLE